MKIRWKTAQFCFLDFFFLSHFVWEVISTIPHRVSSPGETPRSSSKILRCASYQFNYLLGVSSRDEAQRLMLDMLPQSREIFQAFVWWNISTSEILAPLRSGAISKSGSSTNIKALFPVVLLLWRHFGNGGFGTRKLPDKKNP